MSKWWGGVAVGLVVVGAACSDSRPAARPAASAESSAQPLTTTAAPADPAYAPGQHVLSFAVGGVTRTAVLVVPDRGPADALEPLVFVFHGHGGSGRNVERRLGIESLWPDAIVVYPDGLPGHKGITDPDGALPGWQVRPGEEGDRDLMFYDTMLAELRAHLPVDGDRIYLMGHSNGSGLTSLLLALRGASIAATANLSGQPGELLLGIDPVRSMFMSMGMADPLVPFDQQRLSIPLAEQKLGVDTAHASVDGYLRSERGPRNLELETYVHPGGHDVPPEVPKLVVEFFQRHTLSGG